jgi:hypothetical protein
MKIAFESYSKPLKFVGTLLAVFCSMFGLGALSAKLDKSPESHGALIEQAALRYTAIRSDGDSSKFLVDYACRDHVLASYDVGKDAIVYREELAPESPYRISLADTTEFAELATGWKAKEWAKTSVMDDAVEGLSTLRKAAIIVGAGTGFLAGRWYVLGKALKCRQADILDHFKAKEFWQHIIRLKLKQVYDGSIVQSSSENYDLVRHSSDIRQAITKCPGLYWQDPTTQVEFWSGLPDYRKNLDNEITTIGLNDWKQLEKLKRFGRNVAQAAHLQPAGVCLSLKEGYFTYKEVNDELELNSLGTFARPVNLGLDILLYVVLSVAAFVAISFTAKFIWTFTAPFRKWWSAS